MATVNLTGNLSAVAANGTTIIKSGSRYIVTGGVRVDNGGVIDVPLLVDFLEFDGVTSPNAVATIGRKDSPVGGDFFPIDIEITSAGDWSYNTNYRTRGNITINTYNCNIRFTSPTGSASAFGVWPGSGVLQTGVKWNAENTNVICINSSGAPALNNSQGFPAGGGNLKNVSFQGFEKLFFTSSPVSTANVVNVRSTGQLYGITGDTANFELTGGSSDYAALQRISTVTLTDFQIKAGLKIDFLDAAVKQFVLRRRFTTNIQGGASFKYWAWDKDKTNVINSTLNASGILAPTAVTFQTVAATTGTGVVSYTPAQVMAMAANWKAPFTVRSFRYGYRPLDAVHVPDISSPSIMEPHTLSGIADADPHQSGTKAAALALSAVTSTAEAYRVFFAWYEDNGASIDPDAINLPIGGSDFKDWHVTFDSAASQLITVNAATKSITFKAAAVTGNLTTTGSVTLLNGATVTGSIEDANGVRVTVRKSGGGNFNIAARYGSGSTYTDLGYQADVSTITYTVPKGQPVEMVMWALGYVTYSRLISTENGSVVFDAEMTLNESINTTLDVLPYLPNIALSLDTSGASPVFVITFNAAMTIAGIELGKAVIHRLVGQEIALKAGFPPGSTATIVINSDEITNQLPAARLALGAGLSVTDRVYLDFFINTAQALAINPAYVINPPRADGNQVVILRAKPALDASVMALAVRQEIERTGGMLDGKASQASVTALATAAQTEHDATQAAIAALPAPPSATSTAQAVRAELATELGRMDASVSSRLATAAYTTPPSAAEIATQVEIAILNEDDGRQVIEAIADKIKAEEVTAGVIAATVRSEIKPDLQIINTGVKKASLSIPHTGNLP